MSPGGAARTADNRTLRAVLLGAGVISGRLRDASPRQREIASARLRLQAGGRDRARDSGDGGAGYRARRLRLAALIDGGERAE